MPHPDHQPAEVLGSILGLLIALGLVATRQELRAATPSSVL